ncbi:PAS domain S-box protein [Gillisia limnaea]|nr:PAS domain S-box protein [Gillisia limnaea]
MHTKAVKDNIIELRSNVKDAESGQRGYLITNDSVFLQPTIGAEKRSKLVFARLDSLISDHAGQRENLKKLKTLLDERYSLLNKTVKSFKNNQSTNLPTNSLLLESKNKMDEVRKQIALMLQTEDAFLEQRIQVKDRSATLTPIFLLLLSLFSIVALTLFFFRLQKETNSRVSTAKSVEVEAEARKQIEENLREISDYKYALDQSSIVAITNQKGIIKYANDNFCTISKYTRQELIGQDHRIINSGYHSKDFIRNLWTTITNGKTWKGELKNKAKDGTIYWVDTTIVPFLDELGKPYQYVAIRADITVQKKSAEAIEKMATHLTLATDSANVGIWSFNVEKQEIEWSALHKRMWGYDEHRTDLTYEDWHKIILPRDKELAFEKIEEARVNDTVYDVEYRIRRADDETVRYMRSVGRYYYNDKGEAKTLTGISLDITEQKEAEETLRYRKALLEAHNEANRDGLLLVDAKGKIISYNQSFIDVWRMPKEIVDSKDDELALAFAMTQLVNPQQFVDKVKWLYEHPSETSVDELEYLDGRIIERHGYSVLGEDGTYYAWSWTFRDITEQKAATEAIKESETRFRTMAEATEVLIGVADEASNVTYFNKAWVDLTGRPMEDLLKLGWADLFHPEDKDRVVNTYLSAFAKQESYTLEFRVLDKYGKYRWLLAKVPARFNPDGTFAGYISASVDITDRKEAEEKIKETRELFETTLQNVPSAIYHFDKTGKILYLNENGANQIGYATTEEVLAEKDVSQLRKRAYETFSVLNEQGEPMPVDQNSTALTFKTGKSSEVVSQLINKKTGSSLWLLSRASPIYDDNGGLIKVIATSTDITLQKAASEAIRESEERVSKERMVLYNSFMNAPAAIAIVKGDTFIYEFVNAEYEKLVDRKITIGKTVQEHFPEMEQQGIIDILKNVFSTGELFIANEFPIEIINESTGKLVLGYYNSVVQPMMDEKGNTERLLSHGVEVTQQVNARKVIEASEEQFRLFADSIQNLAWIANADGWIYWYNQQWYDYTGTTVEEMQGWGWEKVHHPDHIKKLVKFVKEAWKKDEAFEQTFPLRRHDGEYRWFITRAYPVKDANGNIERWIGTNTDIHEQKITEQKKDEFISVASHEMKTPLTTAKGYIQLLLLSLSEENQAASYAKRVNQAVEKLNDLATELLDASKIQNGQLDYNITTFDLNEMVDETIENIQHSTTNHSIQKTGNCSQQITGDRGRLQQVLINFLTNAIKYSPKADKVFVKIDEQEEKVQVSVQDFGVGMSGKHLDKIFDRYYRVEEHATHFQGLGIGLYISHNIIERHDGTMWAESEPEKGSIFYFTLPL